MNSFGYRNPNKPIVHVCEYWRRPRGYPIGWPKTEYVVKHIRCWPGYCEC